MQFEIPSRQLNSIEILLHNFYSIKILLHTCVAIMAINSIQIPLLIFKLPVLGRPTIWITLGQGPAVLVVGSGGGCLDIFTLIYPFSPLSPSLWETARYRLKYCLKGPLLSKTTNQPTSLYFVCHVGISTEILLHTCTYMYCHCISSFKSHYWLSNSIEI